MPAPLRRLRSPAAAGRILRLRPVPGGLTPAQPATCPGLASYAVFSAGPRDRSHLRHPVQAAGADPMVRTAALDTVPGRRWRSVCRGGLSSAA